jgi:pyrimidine-specific ribonucleoside hydrolase
MTMEIDPAARAATDRPAPLLLDVDTGYDDALALILALRSPDARVLGITCVAGNHSLDHVADNTLRILDLVGAPEIPVALGAAQPLIESHREPSLLHGRDGMGDTGLPASARRPVGEHAVELLRRTIADHDKPITLVALAPLTNIALFIRMYPALAARLAQIVVMGGTYQSHGNTSPLAEFNLRQDPEAAAIVLESGLPILLYPLDPFRQLTLSAAEIAALAAEQRPLPRTVGAITSYVAEYLGRDSCALGDAGALAVALDRSHATIARFPITVELTGTATRGQTVLDRRTSGQRAGLTEWWTTAPAEVEVVTAVDVAYYKARFLGAIES